MTDYKIETKINKAQQVTTCIKHLAVSGLSSVLARIKSSCNLIGNRFEMPNVSHTPPLAAKMPPVNKLNQQIQYIQTF